MGTLEELKAQSIEKRKQREERFKAQQKPRRPFYTFLPKDEKNVVIFTDPKLLATAFEGGQGELILETLGIIANLKRITGQISQDQQNALDCVQQWWEKSKLVDEAMRDQ
jgi:hypothetical protein